MSTLPRRRADFLMEGSRMLVEGPHRWVALVVVTALGYPPYCAGTDYLGDYSCPGINR